MILEFKLPCRPGDHAESPRWAGIAGTGCRPLGLGVGQTLLSATMGQPPSQRRGAGPGQPCLCWPAMMDRHAKSAMTPHGPALDRQQPVLSAFEPERHLFSDPARACSWLMNLRWFSTSSRCTSGWLGALQHKLGSPEWKCAAGTWITVHVIRSIFVEKD